MKDQVDNQDEQGLLPRMDLTRRGFMTTTLATGFALCVQPLAAEPITTSSEGLVTGEVKIPVADGEIPAYRAAPAVGKNLPTVIVVEEIFGVHEHIKDVCRRFAKAGFLAVAPELYSRLGDVTKLTDIKDVIAVVNKAPDTQSFADLDATFAWVGKNGGDIKKVGITGFCRGGRMVWMYAAHNPNLRAGVAWYGPLKGKASEVFPQHPIDVVDNIKIPVLGLYGAKDQGIPVSDVEEMKQKLANGKSRSNFVVYPDADHGFNADYRPSYNADASMDGMKRAIDWLKNYGVQ